MWIILVEESCYGPYLSFDEASSASKLYPYKDEIEFLELHTKEEFETYCSIAADQEL